MSDDDRNIGIPPDWRIDNSQIFPMSDDLLGCFDASNCSTAIKVLELLRNGLEKSETTARARAANMDSGKSL